MPKKTYVKTIRDVAKHFGRSPNAVGHWRTRGMPGEGGKWCLEDIGEWVATNVANVVRPKQWTAEQHEQMTGAKRKLIETKLQSEAESAVARARMLTRKMELQEGSFTSIERVNEFMSQFFQELRQLLERMIADMAAGYSPKMRDQIKKDLTARIEIVLAQMYDWTMITQDLKEEKVVA